MTPAEQNLIENIFSRLRSHGVAARDEEADTLISRLMRETPGAAYALVQSVLVQDQALREADRRIKTLEEQEPGNNAGYSFVGSANRQPSNASPAGPSASASQSGYATAAPSGETGSFMRSALQTAAGVAGGALLFEGVRSLLHGGVSAEPRGSLATRGTIPKRSSTTPPSTKPFPKVTEMIGSAAIKAIRTMKLQTGRTTVATQAIRLMSDWSYPTGVR